MKSERPRRRPTLRASISNWNNSDLPYFERWILAMRNYGRRFGFPPRTCCDHPGEPGC